MCGRFAMDQETNDLIEEFVLDGNDFRDWSISYSIAPTDTVPIIRERTHQDTGEVPRRVEPAVWDFHPSFLKNTKRPQFNARLETVATNGLWKGAFAGGRCIVPMRGYYEWTGEAGRKQPWFIHAGTAGTPGPLLAAAGLATARKLPAENGEELWQVSTAIITTEGRDASGEIHDRMPVFLTPDVYDRWLDPHRLDTDAAKEELLAVLQRVAAEVAAGMTAYEVDRRVNNSRTADPGDPGLILPVG
ncbi:MAG: SOS response-associated peptidase [Micrococcales bacterium]|nr:SOS response-associated peptidase [Micrococcales bacterium]